MVIDAMQDVPILIADATDQASIDRVVKQTKVVIACAGPYAKLGTPVVDACVRLGAHCVDITGSSAKSMLICQVRLALSSCNSENPLHSCLRIARII